MNDVTKYKGYTIKVSTDSDPQNPREWDNVGKMICFHNRYTLGDKHDYNKDSFDSCDELKEQLIADGAYIILPLYLYDHSGITMKTSSFTYRWDSGQVGFIYCTKEDVQREWDGDDMKAKAYIEGEVATYDGYLTGSIYCYEIIDADGNDTGESCGGYFGYPWTYLIIDAQNVIDALVEDQCLDANKHILVEDITC